MTDFDVQHRDCFESLEAMRDAGGADLILTSPPYPDARKAEAYGAEFDTSLAGYQRLGDAVFAALKPGGVCALNIDGPVRKWRGEEVGSERSLISMEVGLDWAKRVGLRYVERCAYVRDSMPISQGPRWRSGWEPVHVFARAGADVYFDRAGCERPAKYAGTYSRPSNRDSGGVKHPRPIKIKPMRSLTTAERFHASGKTDPEHVAAFSRDFADAYVLCYSPPGGLVGDPFAGSGTVPFSCHRHCRRFIGGDLGIRQTHNDKPCGARWADIINDGLRQQRLFA